MTMFVGVRWMPTTVIVAVGPLGGSGSPIPVPLFIASICAGVYDAIRSRSPTDVPSVAAIGSDNTTSSSAPARVARPATIRVRLTSRP